MAEYNLAEELKVEAKALEDAFRIGRIKVKRRLPGIVDEGHFGSYVRLAKLEDGGEMQLWLDRASGHEEPLFWCGIFYALEKDFESAIQRASQEARPKLVLTLEDMQEDVEGGLLPKAPLPVEMMNGTIAERLDRDGHAPEYYIGRYFFDYSTELALTYLSALLGKDVGEQGFWEGEVQQRMASFYERNADARTACISRDGYVCVVCEVDFYKKYGEVGRNFIHVHHIHPLADRGKRTLTKDDELVSVCPNCHAMLHRGGLKTPEALRKMIAQAKE